jgi:membrane protease YdiL (CAAX protease family)
VGQFSYLSESYIWEVFLLLGFALVFKFVPQIRELKTDDPYFRLHLTTVAQASLCIVATIFLYALFAWSRLTLSNPLIVYAWKYISLLVVLGLILIWCRRIGQSSRLIWGPTAAWPNLVMVGLRAAVLVLMVHDLYWLVVPEAWLSGQALYRTSDDLRRYINEQGMFWSAVVIIFTTVMRHGLTVLIEELLYRGLLYSALRKHFSMVPAVWWSSLSFMLGHEWFGLAIFLLGCIQAYLYETYHSILPAIIVHFSWNAHLQVFGWAMSASLISPKTWYFLSLTFALFAFAVLSFLYKRKEMVPMFP